MIFERLRIENFLAIEKAEIVFEPGLHCMMGVNYDMNPGEDESNGCGKTTGWDALRWCLYGSVEREGAKADDVIRRAAGANCKVETHFRHDNRGFVVTRFRKYEKLGDGLDLWIDGVRKTAHLTAETERLLLEALPLPERIFIHGVMVGQGMPNRFLALSESEKQDLLCRAAGIDIYDKALAYAKEQFTRFQNHQVEAASIFNERARGLQRLEEQKAEAVKTLERFDAGVKDFRATAEANVQSTQAIITELEGERAKLAKDALEAEAVYSLDYAEARDRAGRTISAIQDQMKALDGERAQATAFYQAAEHSLAAAQDAIRQVDVAVASIRAEFQGHVRERDKLNALGDVCPTCLQKIDGKHKEVHLTERAREMTRLEKQIEGYSLSSAEVVRIVNDRAREKANAYTAVDQVTQKSNALSANLVSVQRKAQAELQDIDALLRQRKEKAASDDLSYRARIESLEAARDNARAQLGQVDMQRVALVSMAGANDLAIQRLRDQELPAARQTLDGYTATTQHWDYWRTTIPQLRASAVAGVIVYLNQRVALYMDILSGGAMGLELFQVQHGQGSRIRVDLRTASGAYGLSSGGERRRVDLALYLAISDLLQAASGISTNLVVCDEVTDGLSPCGISKLIEILRAKVTGGASVWITSHNPAVRQSARFDSVYMVEKRNGVSTMKRVA